MTEKWKKKQKHILEPNKVTDGDSWWVDVNMLCVTSE